MTTLSRRQGGVKKKRKMCKMPEGWEATGVLNNFRESEQALAQTVIYGNGVCCFFNDNVNCHN